MPTLQTTTSITDYLKSQNQSSDYPSRTKLYSSSGLSTRLGEYIGSGEQNTALLNYLQKQPVAQPQSNLYQTNVPAAAGFASVPVSSIKPPATLPQSNIYNPPTTAQMATPTAPTPTTPTSSQQVPQSLVDAFQRIQQQASALGQRIMTEGVTNEQGKYIVQPQTQAGTPPQPPTTPPTETKQETTTPQLSSDETKKMIETTKIEDTDLGNIISDVSSGNLDTPELKLSEEAKRLSIVGEDKRFKQEFKTLQQDLAKAGMTFSGIRTQAEADAVAQNLANKSGISLDFSRTIISAARSEQQRRETANTAAKKASTDALAQMGYVMIGDKLYPTLEKQEQEAEAPQTIGSADTGYYAWNPQTGKYEQAVAPVATAEKTADIREYEYVTNNGAFTGSYTDWLKYKNENLSSGDPVLDAIRLLTLQQRTAQMTPSEGQLVYKTSQLPASQDLPQTVVTKITQLNSYLKEEGQNTFNRILQLLNDPEVETSPAKAIQEQLYRKGKGFLGTGGLNEKEIELSNLLATFNNEYLYVRSGAQINEKEQKRLREVQPSLGYDKTINIQRTKDFISVIDDIIGGTLDAYGVEFYGGGINLKAQVVQEGYDYDALKADGYSDEEIREELGL